MSAAEPPQGANSAPAGGSAAAKPQAWGDHTSAVADHTFTRCPGCATIFRVTAEQLALREGQVRCGHCRAVFDANDHVVALDARRSDDADVPDELAAGRPTITLRSADALEPVDDRSEEPSPIDEQRAAPEPIDEQRAEPEASQNAAIADDALPTAPFEATKPEAFVASAPIDVRVLDRAGRFEWKPRKPLHERRGTLYGVAIALLLLALAAQGLFEYRDALAAHAPGMRVLLQGAFNVFCCMIEPVRDPAALSIEASDLQADSGHRGLLVLSATIRNRAPYPIAFPYLELTLTDASDQVVVRRAFAPADYVGGSSDPAAGIPGNGENLVKLFLDASATAQAGYRLYLFYP
jgi:predicted Zn finger-like uncharacterized protein